ncbi:hypothetical protein ES708_09020 [subsurface metagenome]
MQEKPGKTWKYISSGLPDYPVNVICEDRKNPDLMFIGIETNRNGEGKVAMAGVELPVIHLIRSYALNL